MSFLIFLTILGSFEIISNLFHLAKGSKEKIAQSAKRQHGEIPKNLTDKHYITKAWIMLIFGILFVLLVLINQYYLTYTILGLFGFYGIIQIIIYKGYWKTIPSAIVYNLPLVTYLLIK